MNSRAIIESVKVSPSVEVGHNDKAVAVIEPTTSGSLDPVRLEGGSGYLPVLFEGCSSSYQRKVFSGFGWSTQSEVFAGLQ